MTGTTTLVLPADDYALLSSHGYRGVAQLAEMKRLLPYIDTMTMKSDTHWVRVLEVAASSFRQGDYVRSDELSRVWKVLGELRKRYGHNAVRTAVTRNDTYHIMVAVAPALTPGELQHIADLVELLNI